jgi:hypothetical protein
MSRERSSVMIWFRARPDDDSIISQRLHDVVRFLAGRADCRIGSRRDEDKPHRTWILDAGPVDEEGFAALLSALRAALAATGLDRLALAPPQFECFNWITDGCA